MLRRALGSAVSFAFLAACVLVSPASADDRVEGVITGVDGGYITVRTDEGHDQRLHIGNRTRVVFQSSADAAAFPNANADVLASGMRVRVNPGAVAGAVLDRLHVPSLPPGARPPLPPLAPPSAGPPRSALK